jgi:hypothetical protein
VDATRQPCGVARAQRIVATKSLDNRTEICKCAAVRRPRQRNASREPAAMTQVAQPSSSQVTVRVADYVRVVSAVGVFCLGLWFVCRASPGPQPPVERLMSPMFALVALTGLVGLGVVLVRNTTVLLGITSPAYYADYASAHPPDWVERPARTFNNLMQVPVLYYVVSLLMLVTGRFDTTQIALAWIFVATRAVHAVVYIGWNYLPLRFACWVAGCISIGVLWFRFATQL